MKALRHRLGRWLLRDAVTHHVRVVPDARAFSIALREQLRGLS